LYEKKLDEFSSRGAHEGQGRPQVSKATKILTNQPPKKSYTKHES